MVSLASRRKVSLHLMDRGFSVRLSSRVCGRSRGALRRLPKDRNHELRLQVLELSEKHPRYGSPRIWRLLRSMGVLVNRKAVERIWREEGLSLRTRTRKKLKRDRPNISRPAHASEVWSMDFVHERLENGRQVRILGVLDAFTRECLLLKAAPCYRSSDVKRDLEWLFLMLGKPERIRTDNGPEFCALSLPASVHHDFIQPGSPWQNGHIESFFGKLRDELLSCELFTSGAELQECLDEFQSHYNNHRPHSALGGLPPSQFAKRVDSDIIQEATITL
ncbi:MAG: IS3 family transposase [Armatimonadetes bacterium]|nr:IS3 family transposase [Armatimonadota bacterium]